MYITLFLTVTALVFALFMRREEGIELKKKRLQHLNIGDETNLSEDKKALKEEKQESLFKRILLPVWVKIKRKYRKRLSNEKEEKLDQLLLQAGSPFNLTAVEFRILQMILFFIFPSLLVSYGFFLGVSIKGFVLLAVVGFLIALLLPYIYLKQKIKERNALAQKELPDILDLLTVSLEAGLGFDSALGKVIMKKEGVLSSEFQRCLEEIRLGKTRKEALSSVRERLTLHEVNVLITNIIQAEKLGMGLVNVFRVQSNEVRERRRQRAEEEAMKAPIKILFPLVLFIFPSIFIVLLGPAIIQFINTF
ncbi:type II secretion system F family protein [Desulfuribacillus alkaliarsenatis]|uniref:Pilus assembly protein TadC n=1 Tax=Desulfuribacillus alkaliarsenatis TaxID=766136 RepID=A0A1E5G0B9_9FIRM|nr:type II secretion system F family protein [Desulfuribacillus alkaliarsenatis]OEF96193.1 pilus assembly protein TadC [Desulfuribacillus alkaliarsenatis]